MIIRYRRLNARTYRAWIDGDYSTYETLTPAEFSAVRFFLSKLGIKVYPAEMPAPTC